MRYEFAMMKVIRSSGCGNSSKQKLVVDMSVALAGADVGIMASLAVPELVWLHIGKKPIEGQDAVLSAIRKSGPATEVAVDRVVSHGRAGAGGAALAGNVVLGGLIGAGVDSTTGATNELVPNPLHLVLEEE